MHTPKRLSFALSILLLAGLLMSCVPPAPAPSPTPVPLLSSELTTEIETLVEEMMAQNEIPGYALGIVVDGQIAYIKGFGVEEVGTERPVTVHSVFGTGSVGKTATATAAMQLVAEGKIDLQAPITDYLPYFTLADERYKDITAYHLITSRSGLANIEDWYPLPVEYDDGVLERYVRSLNTSSLLFAPGTNWSYSSTGFAVLADIVAKTSGQTFEAFVQDNVLDPLGMDDTMLIIQEADQGKVASPHVKDAAGTVVVNEIFPYRRQFAPAVLLYSSITDLARYAAAHLNRGEFEGVRILPATDYDVMWAPISKTTFRPGPILTPMSTDFGMGWIIGTLDGHPCVDLLGFDEGYGGGLILAPDDNVAVVMATNYFDSAEFNMSTWEAAAGVMALVLNTEK